MLRQEVHSCRQATKLGRLQLAQFNLINLRLAFVNSAVGQLATRSIVEPEAVHTLDLCRGSDSHSIFQSFHLTVWPRMVTSESSLLSGPNLAGTFYNQDIIKFSNPVRVLIKAAKRKIVPVNNACQIARFLPQRHRRSKTTSTNLAA